MGIIDVEINDVAPSDGRGVFPNGVYKLAAVEADYVQSKTNPANWMVTGTLEVVEGPFQGRRLWINCNIKNASAKAVEIGKGEYNALCRACGKLGEKNPALIKNIVFTAEVGSKTETNRSGVPEPKNIINKYYKPGETPPAASMPAAKPKATAAAMGRPIGQAPVAGYARPAQPTGQPIQPMQPQPLQPVYNPNEQQQYQQTGNGQLLQQPPIQQPIQYAPQQQPQQYAPVAQPVQQQQQYIPQEQPAPVDGGQFDDDIPFG